MDGQHLGRWALGALVVAVVLWVAGLALAGGPAGPGPWGMGPGMMFWGWGPGVGWPAMALMMLGGLLFWIAVILGFVLLVRALLAPGGGAAAPTEPDALELARRRYARGEISREEFERIVADLRRSS